MGVISWGLKCQYNWKSFLKSLLTNFKLRKSTSSYMIYGKRFCKFVLTYTKHYIILDKYTDRFIEKSLQHDI
jgi:hypothetical protein